jgi:hypothetical protein
MFSRYRAGSQYGRVLGSVPMFSLYENGSRPVCAAPVYSHTGQPLTLFSGSGESCRMGLGDFGIIGTATFTARRASERTHWSHSGLERSHGIGLHPRETMATSSAWRTPSTPAVARLCNKTEPAVTYWLGRRCEKRETLARLFRKLRVSRDWDRRISCDNFVY